MKTLIGIALAAAVVTALIYSKRRPGIGRIQVIVGKLDRVLRADETVGAVAPAERATTDGAAPTAATPLAPPAELVLATVMTPGAAAGDGAARGAPPASRETARAYLEGLATRLRRRGIAAHTVRRGA